MLDFKENFDFDEKVYFELLAKLENYAGMIEDKTAECEALEDDDCLPAEIDYFLYHQSLIDVYIYLLVSLRTQYQIDSYGHCSLKNGVKTKVNIIRSLTDISKRFNLSD